MPYFIEPLETLERSLNELGIPTTEPGFYDDPRFIQEEGSDPHFLNCYPSYINQRTYSSDYVERVRKTVPIVARILHRELVAEGRLGACVDLSMVFARILEREKIWCYMVKGALTISFPSKLRIKPLYFWPLDVETLPGHVWVAAPPFRVMDLTLRQQPYEERIFQHLPDYLLIENGNRCSAKIEDICSPEVRAAHLVGRRPKQDLHFVLSPNLPYVFKAFPGVLVRRNQVSFKYFTCGFSASEEGLEQIRNQRWNKRYGFEIYEDLIKPALSELDD